MRPKRKKLLKRLQRKPNLLKNLQKLRRLNLKPLTMLMKPKQKRVNSLMKLAKLKRKKVSQKGLFP